MKRVWFAKSRPTNNSEDLKDFIKDIPKNSVLLEVGTGCGVSTMMFAKRCKKVVSIDGYDKLKPYGVMTKERFIESEKRFRKYINRFKKLKKKVNQIKEISSKAVERFSDGEFDIVYLDGDHFPESFRSDLHNWLPKIKEGGILSGHDYQITHVPSVLKEIMGRQPDKLYKDGSWMYQL